MDFVVESGEGTDGLIFSPLGTPYIYEEFEAPRVAPVRMDQLWEQGWRHFGSRFVRYSRTEWNGRAQIVRPLRVVLDDFEPTKSHRRVLRRNKDLFVKVQPVALDAERARMFNRHKRRFSQHIPLNLQTFLGEHPEDGPCETLEIGVYQDARLVAASYLDLGQRAVSTQYGIFDPSESKRSLGILTMLEEIAYAKARGCHYYYVGYVYRDPSELDYKKQFRGMEWYDWRGQWRRLPKGA